jgi:molybdenum cofactor guanylyltransferase
MQDTDLKNVTLAILAGGAGSRMGRPKASLLIHGRPILEFLLERFDWPGPTMLVLAPGMDRSAGSQRVSLVVSDPVAGQGPLRGVLTALQNSPTPNMLATTIDMPAIEREQLEWLATRPFDCGLMMTHQSQIEPFPFAVRTSACDAISMQLAQNRRSVHAMLKLPGFASIEAPSNWPESIWTNLNEPADLERFLARP